MRNKGMCQHRLKQNPLEKAFAEAWEEINTDERVGVLDWLMAKETNNPYGEATDRMVAATVIQWLGSPVGQRFLAQVQEDEHK